MPQFDYRANNALWKQHDRADEERTQQVLPDVGKGFAQAALGSIDDDRSDDWTNQAAAPADGDPDHHLNGGDDAHICRGDDADLSDKERAGNSGNGRGKHVHPEFDQRQVVAEEAQAILMVTNGNEHLARPGGGEPAQCTISETQKDDRDSKKPKLNACIRDGVAEDSAEVCEAVRAARKGLLAHEEQRDDESE